MLDLLVCGQPLRCDLPTLQKRIALKRQRKNRKVINLNSIVEKFRTDDLFIPPSAIEIENSDMSIKEVAQEIVNQMHKLSIALFTIIRTDRNMLLACYSHKHISYRIRTIIRKAITLHVRERIVYNDFIY